MKLDARRAFIKSSKGRLGGIVINTPAENLLPGNIRKAQSDTREYAMWMQKGMEVERYRKESIANQTVYLPQIILQWPWTRKK
jgi:hypothetical protein